MKNKTVFITGATNGIGLETALVLARQNANVAFTARDQVKGQATLAQLNQLNPNGKHQLFIGDLSSQADIRRIAAEFKAQNQTLDVLINNAGGFFETRRTTVDQIEYTFALNHLSYFLLTNLLLDTLKASVPSRIINVASSAQAQGKMNFEDLQFERNYSGMTAYFQSKLANVIFTNDLAQQLYGTGVTVNSLHPGVVRTGFGAGTKGFLGVMIALIRQFGSITPEEGAKTTIFLATEPSLNQTSGQYFEKRQAKAANPIASTSYIQHQLWKISLALTKTP